MKHDTLVDINLSLRRAMLVITQLLKPAKDGPTAATKAQLEHQNENFRQLLVTARDLAEDAIWEPKNDSDEEDDDE